MWGPYIQYKRFAQVTWLDDLKVTEMDREGIRTLESTLFPCSAKNRALCCSFVVVPNSWCSQVQRHQLQKRVQRKEKDVLPLPFSACLITHLA